MATVDQSIHYIQPGRWLARHKTLAMGLWIAALDILLQVATGASGHPKVPPGMVILVVVGIGVYFTSRWRRTAVAGLFLSILISVGCLQRR